MIYDFHIFYFTFISVINYDGFYQKPMAIFAANFTLTQSSDGVTLYFTDTSNYGISDPVITISNFSSRQLVLLDANGTSIETVDLGTNLSAEIIIARDKWVNATLNLVGINPVGNYTKNYLFPFDRITKNLYRKALKGGCCNNPLIERALSEADRFFRGAEISAPAGDGPGWTNAIDSAYAYLITLDQ
jgi:hypothetical protein